MKILGVIPARGGSKGVPKKNLKSLGGKPLIAYTIEEALRSKLITKLVVSTDSLEIARFAESMGVFSEYIRPEFLAQDDSSTLSVIQHIYLYMIDCGYDFDAVCILQPTTPFRKKGAIDKAVELFISRNTDSLISVNEVPHVYNPHWCFELMNSGNLEIATGELEIISRRQNLPKAYFRDGAIYLVKSNVLVESGSLYGKSISCFEEAVDFDINIDTPEDWALAEKIIDNSNYGHE